MKWFFCLNEGDWQFEMAQVAIHTARQNTNLEPVCIYDGNNKTVIDWMNDKNIPIIFHRSSLYEQACKIYDVPPNTPRSAKVTGAWTRIDIPNLTDENYVLYTDTDVMFLGDCKGLEDVKPEYIACVNDFNPFNSFNMNSGVLVMNTKNLRLEYDDFISFIKTNMTNSWSTYDQVAYDCFYAYRSLRLPLEFNWKSFWEVDYAVWSPPEIRVQRTIPVQILHFTGIKPWDKTQYKEGMGLYRGSNNYIWQKKWLEYFSKIKFSHKKEVPATVKHNVLYPYHVFSNTSSINDSEELEKMIIDFGVNTTDSSKEYPDWIRLFKPKLEMRIWQQPNQLASFLTWIYDRREEINNYTEIGVAYGGSFYIIDSYLRAINPKYNEGIAVDINSRMMEFYNYSTKFNVKFIQTNSLSYVPEKPIDLCFIDTFHTYDQTIQEYNHYKKFCKYIAFHDIDRSDFQEMKKFWKEIKNNHTHWEFIQQYPGNETMGIGVIKI